MTRARYLVGDVHEALATLPEGSVDLVLTSPPFLALRSYLPDDHPDKAKEIGSEPTPRWWAEEGRFWQTNRLRGPANAQPVLFPWEAAG